MTAYYNEYDPKAAAWLRELIKQGHIADGVVDERSIEDVTPNDLNGFTQCHFFAGIGVWSYALRQSKWADDRPVWTGSCPCQPFSAAGKGAGFADERHLWPAFHHLISQCRPDIIFGEQVASKDGLGWLDLVHSDLEATGYASGAVDLCAAGIGAPHIRQRLWWVGARLADTRRTQRLSGQDASGFDEIEAGQWQQNTSYDQPCGSDDWLADPASQRLEEQELQRGHGPVKLQEGLLPDDGAVSIREQSSPSPINSFWRDADWLFCRDGKWRPVEPSTFPLAYGSAERVGRLRGYGNAIVAQAAQAVIKSMMETMK